MSDKTPIIIKKRRKKDNHGSHGGSWKIAYADFVTAMMAFFLLMWLVNITSEAQRKGIADYFAPNIVNLNIRNGSAGMMAGANVSNANNSNGQSSEATQKDKPKDADDTKEMQHPAAPDTPQNNKKESPSNTKDNNKQNANALSAEDAKKMEELKKKEKSPIPQKSELKIKDTPSHAATKDAAIDTAQQKEHMTLGGTHTKDQDKDLIKGDKQHSQGGIKGTEKAEDKAIIENEKQTGNKRKGGVDAKDTHPQTTENPKKGEAQKAETAKIAPTPISAADQKANEEKALKQVLDNAKAEQAATTYERSIEQGISAKITEQQRALQKEIHESKARANEVKKLQEAEQTKLQEMASELKNMVKKSPELQGLLSQVILEIRPEGLRIQLIDQDNKSMFPSGSSAMHPETKSLIKMIASLILPIPNQLVISGHTDAHPFTNARKYSNWELSADRANATRRALEDAQIEAKRFESVMGKEATDPFVKDDPFAAANRRISITLLRQFGTPSSVLFDKLTAPHPPMVQEQSAAPAAALPTTPPPATPSLAMLTPAAPPATTNHVLNVIIHLT